MKYIFLAGAPGSKWSSVSEDIRNFKNVNISDSSQGHYIRPGDSRPMHTGAYWDPGMEYGNNFDELPRLTTEDLEWHFDQPFMKIDNNPRIIKSHQFCKWLDNIIERPEWEYNPIVLVQRPADDAERWWLHAGGWNITYPSYEWYRGQMSNEIQRQVEGINRFIENYPVQKVDSVRELAQVLGMENTTDRRYEAMDVYVYLHPRLRYFKDTWKGNLPAYEYSGLKILDNIGPDETVLDVGCGVNHFKQFLGDRVTGIDPINPKADWRVSIDEFMISGQYDHTLCLGSINFGTRLDIERQVRKVVACTKKGGYIHWRMNPGRYDHGNPGQEHLNLFPWSEKNAFEIARRNNCDIELFLNDSNNRYYSLWKKL